MKVTVCQIDPREDFLDACLQNLIEHLLEQKSDFLLLPEMSFSAWLAADSKPSAERWNNSIQEHNRHIGKLLEYGVASVLGTRPINNETGSRRNQAYIWNRESNKVAGFHEKHYLPNENGYWEDNWYDRGPKSFDVARAADATVGVQICTEMWFFEWARHYAASGVDILCVPRATPHGSTGKWLIGGQTASVCCGAYCLSSNLWCPADGNQDLGGLAWVVDPEGNILAQTDSHKPFATVEIDLEFSKLSKSTYPRYVAD
ncbi:MAG: N-carbamoylputrescine amidase [Parasphingorhabdus sp.]|jgi:N-carbamoylputrescine amidase